MDSELSDEELEYWGELAKELDIESFDFNNFINSRFDAYNIQNSIDFVKTWIECDKGFVAGGISLRQKGEGERD